MTSALSLWVAAWALSLVTASGTEAAAAPETAVIEIRSQPQTLYLYGTRGATPVLVSSGDGGWMHLAPHVAEVLAARGYFVVGFDVKQYLSGFTSSKGGVTVEDVPADYRVLTDFAAIGVSQRVMLIGISEGAGLSLLAATSPQSKGTVGGVIGLGLPDINELGWRWQDSVIYLTHGVPNEPTFSTSAVALKVTPIPLAAIQSTTDDYVSLAEVEKVMQQALEPKRLWIIKAADHSFSDKLPELDARLSDAIAWATQHNLR